ncbi:MAG: hypothetical protein ACREQK_08850 [Candidatus Binatia bacterium]
MFGAALVLNVHGARPEALVTPKALAQFVNEVIFPVGCSLALFAADVLGKRTAR